jgi:hypothetical protein
MQAICEQVLRLELSGHAEIQFQTNGTHAILRAPIGRALAPGPLYKVY